MKKMITMVTTIVMIALMNMTCNAAVLSSKLTNAAATSGAKTLYVIGDSYSSFDVNKTHSNAFYYPFNKTDDNDVSSLDDTWREKLAKKAGLSVTGVDAYSGSSITDRPDDDKPSIVERIETAPRKNASIIILMGGLNDAWQNVEIGSPDQSSEDDTKFVPALRHSLKMLKENNPDSKIIYSFIVYDDDMNTYEEAARAVCEEEYVTFVPIYGREISCKGWHPTVAGMETIANKLLPYVTDNDVFSASVTCATISGI